MAKVCIPLTMAKIKYFDPGLRQEGVSLAFNRLDAICSVRQIEHPKLDFGFAGSMLWSSECRQNPCKSVEHLEELELCSSGNGRENAESRLAHTVGVTGSNPNSPIREIVKMFFAFGSLPRIGPRQNNSDDHEKRPPLRTCGFIFVPA